MKRKIEVRCEGVLITATINTNGDLAQSEVAAIREELADRLQRAAAGLPYLDSPLNRVRVR